jgi:UMF1 family MFS transporter
MVLQKAKNKRKSKQSESFRCGFKGVASWCLFDWAHQPFPTVITTFIFSTFFIKSVAPNEIKGTEYWSWAVAVSGIFVAILAPILGSICDKSSRRKPWLFVLAMITIICSALLYFTEPSISWLWWALIFYAVANIAYECSQVFYNALMIGISPPSKIGRLSGWGWGTGYFGGIVCLLLSLYLVQGGFLSATMAVKYICIIVSIWFFIFALPLFFFTPDLTNQKSKKSFSAVISEGVSDLKSTLKDVQKYKYVFLYFIAHLIYADGLTTLFAFGGIYAAGTFHMSTSDIIKFGIAMNVTAGIGSFCFSWVDDKLGSKFTIMLSLICLMVLTFAILLVNNVVYFWIIGLMLCVFVGPVQASSRSYMAHVSPPHKITQFFGLYALTGRMTAFIGPALLGVLTAVFKSQRAGMSIILIMFLLGFVLMLYVPNEKKGKTYDEAEKELPVNEDI